MNIEKMREAVATAIWNIRREEEDRCDIDLDDLDSSHSVWAEADASIKAVLETLVVTLPVENPLGFAPGDFEGGLPSFEQHCAAECNSILADCREAIESLGLKVKP